MGGGTPRGRRPAGGRAVRGRARRGRLPAAPALVAFYPTDSPLAPVQGRCGVGRSGGRGAGRAPVGGGGRRGGARQRLRAVLPPDSRCGAAPDGARARRRGVHRRGAAGSWCGADAPRTTRSPRYARPRRRPRAPGRVPRRSAARAAGARANRGAASGGLRAEAAERVSVVGVGSAGATLSGRWSLLAPSPENDTVRAVALVESILDRLPACSRATWPCSPAYPAAWAPSCRCCGRWEDAGDLLRGMFVKGLGPAQFAARETVDLLRTYAADGDARDGRSGAEGCVVLAADDPACLFGAGLPWPPLSGGDAPSAARPARRPGSLVAMRAGVPVLYAAAGLRSVLAFTADGEGARRGCPRTRRPRGARGAPRRGGGRPQEGRGGDVQRPARAGTRRSPTSSSGRASSACPDGMRLYVEPFAR